MKTILAIMAAGLLLATGASWAQEKPNPVDAAVQISKAQKANAMAIRNYIWTQRTEIVVEGKANPAQLHLIRFDVEGEIQRTPMNAPPEEKKKRGVRGRVQKKAEKKAKEAAQAVSELVKKYTFPSTGTLVDFFQKATFAPGTEAMKGTVHVQGSGFLMPGDSVSFWFDQDTGEARRFTFHTSLDGNSVDGAVDYRALPDGPTYPARTVVDIPEEEVRATIENFDFREQPNESSEGNQ
jgi:hypothetical protein